MYQNQRRVSTGQNKKNKIFTARASTNQSGFELIPLCVVRDLRLFEDRFNFVENVDVDFDLPDTLAERDGILFSGNSRAGFRIELVNPHRCPGELFFDAGQQDDLLLDGRGGQPVRQLGGLGRDQRFGERRTVVIRASQPVGYSGGSSLLIRR